MWHKPNAMPESVRDRLSVTHEFVLLLTKAEDFDFDLDAIRIPHRSAGITPRPGQDREPPTAAHRQVRRRQPAIAPRIPVRRPQRRRATPVRTSQGQEPRHRLVHPHQTRPTRHAHCATFPLDLPLRAIAAGSATGGVVLDPFQGSGTTAVAARQLSIGVTSASTSTPTTST
nr:site-specific DNA-methyltransferase [Fodinicola feengrottensis]